MMYKEDVPKVGTFVLTEQHIGKTVEGLRIEIYGLMISY